VYGKEHRIGKTLVLQRRVDMPSFDIVSELDLMEVENAVNQTAKEIEQRFDFRGGKSSLELDKTAKKIKIMADDEMKLRSIHQILHQKMAKRNIDLRGLKYNPEEQATGNMIRQIIDLKASLEKTRNLKSRPRVKATNCASQARVLTIYRPLWLCSRAKNLSSLSNLLTCVVEFNTLASLARRETYGF
jgi:uncharacterized protein YajQ (UPF0234 family)